MDNQKLFYGIAEVADMLGVRPSVLRFWETQFPQLKPYKNKHGSRSYSQHDLELLRRIHYLTRDCGFTLEGAREQLRRGDVNDERMQMVDQLQRVRSFLVIIKDDL